MIFGIGLPKTGNTSFTTFLKQQGLYGVQYPARDIKIWNSIINKKCKFQYVVDTPCNLEYELLDKLYPNSKFIYTYRNQQDWEKSLKIHLNKNICRHPFAKEARKKWTKYKIIDEHLSEVKQIITPNKLFVLDLDNLNLKNLCEFLNLSLVLKYPHKNKTKLT